MKAVMLTNEIFEHVLEKYGCEVTGHEYGDALIEMKVPGFKKPVEVAIPENQPYSVSMYERSGYFTEDWNGFREKVKNRSRLQSAADYMNSTFAYMADELAESEEKASGSFTSGKFEAQNAEEAY